MRLKPLAWIVALACVGPMSAAQPDRISAEIARLSSDAPKVIAEDSRGAILSRLERARTALASGDTYLALYDLQTVFEAEGGYRVAATAKSVPDHAAFTRTWTEFGAPAVTGGAKKDVPVFVEALAQSAEGRAPATYRASLPYAEDAGLMAGLYYLGESHAMVKFAALCRSLEMKPVGRRLTLSSIEPALRTYENAVVKAYDAAAAASRPQYAGVNVAIKLARTLNEQGHHEGALLQYLVSRYRYRLIEASDSPVVGIEAVKVRVKNTRLPAGTDHSIAEFFLQLASAGLNATEATGAGASAILDDILPAYLAVVTR